MKKKILGILLCGVVVLVITGCGSSNTTKLKKYLMSIGYECKDGGRYTCTKTDSKDNSIDKYSFGDDWMIYWKTFVNGSEFILRQNDEVNGSVTYNIVTSSDKTISLPIDMDPSDIREKLFCRDVKDIERKNVCDNFIDGANSYRNEVVKVFNNANVNLDDYRHE